MKKIILSLILSVILLFTTNIPIHANESFTDNQIEIQKEILGNGNTIITTIQYDSTRSSLLRNSTVSGSKKVDYLNANQQIMWTFTVHGTFSISGTSVTCTSASHTVSILGSGWNTISSSSGKSGNSASASAKVGYYSLGILIQSIERTLTLSCDSNGKLS